MDEPRSAVIVPVAIPGAIERLRRTHVPVATAGVPPHVTLLSPFLPATALDETVRARLVVGLAAFEAFEARFEAVQRFPDALYLAPEPEGPFRELIMAVCGLFPGLPPYGEPSYRPEDVVPHLTIAIGDGTGFEGLAAEIEGSLPFERSVDSLAVVAEGVDRRWRLRWRLGLRP